MARKLLVEVAGDTRQYEKSLQRAARDTSKFNREIGKMGRGAAAGSGAFKSLGRSLAFASGGFIATASVTDLLRDSIEQASQAAVAQKQLAAQFKASGQNLAQFQSQIDQTVNSLSNLAGIEDDEVKSAFVLAFRATQNTTEGLRLTAIAADVAKARHIALSQAVLALNKAYGGNVGALRRLGITIPNSLKGMQALEFVSRRFAGQAAAGTTSQERFNASLKNMEQAIGQALLPVFENLLEDGSKWLGSAENQKKVTDDLAASVTSLGEAFAVAAKGASEYQQATKKIDKLPEPLKEILKTLFVPGFGLHRLAQGLGLSPRGGIAPSSRSGQSTLDRQPGFSAGGPGFLQNKAALAAIAGAGPLGFRAQMTKLAIAMAKAELTQAQKDDRAVLVEMAALIKQRITRVKTLKDRRDLYEQLASVTQQIQAIDEQAAQDAKDAHDKQLAAQQQAADAAKEHAAKIKAALERQKQALERQKQAFKDAANTVISQMGQLFDVFVPDDPAKGILGVLGGKISAKSLTARLKTQTDQFARFNNDLARLSKRGAPPALIAALRDQGIAGGANVHALATAGRGDLNAFLRQYNRRQRVAQTIAHADIQAKTVFITTGSIGQRATSPSSQRRGPKGGVVIQGGNARGD